MKRLTWGLALVAAFVAGGLLMNRMILQAQDKVEPKPRGQLYAKWKELGLSKDQIEKVYKIQSEHRAKIAKLDAEMEHQTARETTAGQPKPLGKRGARMADTVGPAQA